MPSRGSRLHTVIRLSVALLMGLGLAFLPFSTRNWSESGTVGILRGGINFLAIPGIVVGMIVAGNVHLMSLWVVNISNGGFYSWISYLILRAWAKRRTKVLASKGEPR